MARHQDAPPGDEFAGIYAKLRILDRQMKRRAYSGIPMYTDEELGAIQESFGPGFAWINATDHTLNWISRDKKVRSVTGVVSE